MDQEDIDRILSFGLDHFNNGTTILKRSLHNFPAVYVLYLQECGRYYIGSTSNLYYRMHTHLSSLKGNKNGNPLLQKSYNESKNKTIRLSFIRIQNRKAGYELEGSLIDKHLKSGLLFNSMTVFSVSAGRFRKPYEYQPKPNAAANRRETGTKNISKAWAKNRRAVSIDGVVFSSVKEAAESLGITHFNLLMRLSGLKKPNSKYRNRYFYI